jgi:hypothetical protein
MPKKHEPPILKTLDTLYEKQRGKIVPLYPYDKKTNAIDLPNEVVAELKSFLLAGNKPAAVKRVAELTGAGLRVSKDYVDGLSKVKTAASTYAEPVSKLLTFGATDWDEWDDYSEFGFTTEHVPELIRLGTDRHLLIDKDVDEDEIWAPVHAWRVLAQLQAVEAVVPLAQVLDWSRDTDADLINECLTDALEKFGAPALEPLTLLINEPNHKESGYISASGIMGKIGVSDPEQRDRAVQIISSALEAHFENNDEDVNGFWIADLLDLKAVESYMVIKKVFEAGKVNLRVAGDLEDVELEFGMREKRDTPPPNLPLPGNFLRNELIPGFQKVEISKNKGAKEKNRRKQEKKSRKKNRKKK